MFNSQNGKQQLSKWKTAEDELQTIHICQPSCKYHLTS